MYFTSVVALVYGLASRSYCSPFYKWITFYLSVSVLFSLLFEILWWGYRLNPFWLQLAYRLAEMGILLEFYYAILIIKRKNAFRVATFILWLTLLIIFESEMRPIRIASSITFSIFSILFYRKVIIDLKTNDLLKVPDFWFNAGILVHFTGSLFLFLTLPKLVQLSESAAIGSYIIHNFLGSCKNLLIIAGCYFLIKARRFHVADDGSSSF